MKKLFLLTVAFGATPVYVLKAKPVYPGTFKIVDTANGAPNVPVALVILNQNANQNVDDQPGWNWTSLTAHSRKTNPLYVDGTVTPLIPATIPVNFATAVEAYDSFVAGTYSVAY